MKSHLTSLSYVITFKTSFRNRKIQINLRDLIEIQEMVHNCKKYLYRFNFIRGRLLGSDYVNTTKLMLRI